MSRTFTVDPVELFQMANTVNGLKSQIAGHNLTNDTIEGMSGSRIVDDAYDTFVGHWSNGLWQIGEHLQGLSDQLINAADTYQATEKEICSKATPVGPAGVTVSSGARAGDTPATAQTA